MQKKIKKLLIFPATIDSMVREIIEKKGYASYTAVIHQAVIAMHGKLMPAYTNKAKTRESLEAQRLAGKMKFVDRLAGKVVEQNGEKVCKFFNYRGKDRFPQVLAVSLLTQDIVDKQYYPTREKVERLQKEKKVNY